jgi:hypothetical protein
MKRAILRYLNENFDDLLELDLKLARILGAPSPHTLSSYSYKLEQEGKLWGKFWRPVIDKVFKWLLTQIDHCKTDYNRVTNGH